MSRFVVTGTDTDVGKTVFAAALAGFLNAHYWKPVQAGLEPESDSDVAHRLAGQGCTVLPEAYRLTTPCSPDAAARIDGVRLDASRLTLPPIAGPLVVEGAGGALVPLNDDLLFADVFVQWGLPIIIVAGTQLGTINHSLMTIEALQTRGLNLHGVVFSGDANVDSEASIIRHGRVRHLGRLPRLNPLNAQTLQAAFTANIAVEHLT
jgi:dethiobiotin synthetase